MSSPEAFPCTLFRPWPDPALDWAPRAPCLAWALPCRTRRDLRRQGNHPLTTSPHHLPSSRPLATSPHHLPSPPPLCHVLRDGKVTSKHGLTTDMPSTRWPSTQWASGPCTRRYIEWLNNVIGPKNCPQENISLESPVN